MRPPIAAQGAASVHSHPRQSRGTIPQRDTARGHDAKPRTAPGGAAARWGHRALPQRDTSVGRAAREHERCARPRDRATGHERCARQRDTSGAQGNGVRAWSAATGPGNGTGGTAWGVRGGDDATIVARGLSVKPNLSGIGLRIPFGCV